MVDSGSTDRTREIASSFGAKVWSEPWKGFAAQKNSALEKATGDWILSLDADEEVSAELARSMQAVLSSRGEPVGYWVARRNLFLGKWVKRGGFYPDRKLRLWRRGAGHFEDALVHETAKVEGTTSELDGDLVHDAYPTLEKYIEHMNRYSSLGAQAIAQRSMGSHSFLGDVIVRPALTFFYNYFVRLGFLDGREGLLLHWYHAGYVSWKYAKVWELSRRGARVQSRNI